MMDPLITHLVERARSDDPRLRHLSLRSLPLMEVTHDEMYAVVESLQYNTHVSTFDMSLHYDDNDTNGDIIEAENDDATAIIPRKPPPPFECIFSRNTSLTDVRISSSCSSILGSVFRGLAYNSSVQILQVGEMSAAGETMDMDKTCSFALKAMLERNTTIHRLALQGFRWDDEQALRWTCEGLRNAHKSLRVLELLQIVATTGRRRETDSSLTLNNAPSSATIPFDEETTYRSKLDKVEATVSTNLMAAIAAMKHLKRLCIISCELSDTNFSPLAKDENLELGTDSSQSAERGLKRVTSLTSDEITEQPQLEELRLVECELTGAGINTLRHACANNPCLRILDVRSNQLEDDSCHALADILNTATSLTKVILEDNSIGDDGLVTLCKHALAKGCSNLLRLCFKNNDFGPKGVHALAKALQKNLQLQELDLSNNHVGDEGADALGSLLQANTALRSLLLENAKIGGPGVLALCNGLQANQTLHKLNLSSNTLDVTGIEALSALLSTQQSSMSALSSLRLSSCALGDAGITALAKALEQNTVLEELVLPFNRFGDEGAKAIGQSLRSWKGLASLQIQFNLFTDTGFASIIGGLSQNYYLKSMYVLNAGPSNRRIDDLFQEMQHWIRLNRAGRRSLNEPNLSPALLPSLLARAGSAYGSNGIFFLLRERPDALPLQEETIMANQTA